MATITYAARIQDDLQLLISSPTMIDATNQRDADVVENTALSLRASQMAAAKIEGILGEAGNYDDADGTIGDQQMLDLGIRLAMLYMTQVYSLTLNQAGVDYIGSVIDEAKDLARSRRQAVAPILKSIDSDDLNKRHDGSTWPDDEDTTGQD